MILSGQLLQRPHYALGAELVALAVVALLMIALGPVLGAALTMLLGAIMAAALVATSWFLFTSEGILIRSEVRRVGKGSVSTCCYRRPQIPYKKHKESHTNKMQTIKK